MTNKPPYKIERVLQAFIGRGRRGMNCVEANKEFGDTCLHASVSKLRLKHGLNFATRIERYPNRAGGYSSFKRYTLTPNQIEQCRRILDYYRKKRSPKLTQKHSLQEAL